MHRITLTSIHHLWVPAEAPESKGNSYAMCHYKQCDYYHAFVACAKKIRALDSSIRIHANSETGQRGGAPIANDPATLPLVDAWTHHTVNCGSDVTFGNQTAKWNYGKFDFTNEMEYQPGNPLAGTYVGVCSWSVLQLYLDPDPVACVHFPSNVASRAPLCPDPVSSDPRPAAIHFGM